MDLEKENEMFRISSEDFEPELEEPEPSISFVSKLCMKTKSMMSMFRKKNYSKLDF